MMLKTFCFVLHIYIFSSNICTFHTFSFGFNIPLSTLFFIRHLPGSTVHVLMAAPPDSPDTVMICISGVRYCCWVFKKRIFHPFLTSYSAFGTCRIVTAWNVLLEQLHILEAKGKMYLLRWICSTFWCICGVTLTQLSQILVTTQYLWIVCDYYQTWKPATLWSNSYIG